MGRKPIIAAVGVAALALAATALAAPNNGGFEAVSFEGWERTEPGGGHWELYNSDDNPPPPVGDFAARVDQDDPGLNILHRTLNAKNGRFLSFYLAYDNENAGEFATPRSFKFNNFEDLPNQQARVDLLKKDAKIKSLKRSDILKTMFRTTQESDLSQSYQFYVVDLEAEGIEGKFQFRVAEVDNVGPWFVGFDELHQSDLAP